MKKQILGLMILSALSMSACAQRAGGGEPQSSPQTTKTLVAYFSASGVTAQAAKTLADVLQADLFEIVPAQPYTDADLDWTNDQCRSTLEMKDRSSRPAVASHVQHMEQYDTLFVGFPIWWHVAPTIVCTFLEQYDLSGKVVVPFFTSGGSGAGETLQQLRPSAPSADWKEPHSLNRATADDMKKWIEKL